MATILMRRIGQSIRLCRKRAGYTQEHLAGLIGMHRTYYSAIERGEKNLQIDTLQRICAGLGVPVWEVLRDTDD